MLIVTDANEIMIRHLDTLAVLGVFKGKPVVGLINAITFRNLVWAGWGDKDSLKACCPKRAKEWVRDNRQIACLVEIINISKGCHFLPSRVVNIKWTVTLTIKEPRESDSHYCWR